MEVPQLSVDTYAALCLVIITPWLYQTFKPFSTDRPAKTRTEQAISALLLTHTLYMLYEILVSPPQNIFKAFGFGLGAPPEHMRAKVAETYGGEQNIPAHLLLLLKRLGLSDLRLLYVRFGHNVLTTCSYCHSYGDFALYAFPGPLLEYVREIAFVGLLTLPKSTSERYRPLGLGALLVALMTEAYWTLTAEARLPTNSSPDISTIMWHDLFVQLRHTLFFALPLLLVALPWLGLHRLPVIGPLFPAPPAHAGSGLPPAQYVIQGQKVTLPDDATLLSASTLALQTLSHLVPALHLFKYANAAVMRIQSNAAGTDDTSPAPHERASRWWAAEAYEGRALREDAAMRAVLTAAGLSIEPEVKEGDAVVRPEGQLLSSAKTAVKFLQEQGSVPSGLWMP